MDNDKPIANNSPNEEKSKCEKQHEDNYAYLGMVIGMIVGSAISVPFDGFLYGGGIGVGLTLGYAIGTCIKKKGKGESCAKPQREENSAP